MEKYASYVRDRFGNALLMHIPSVTIFSLLLLPFVGLIPYLDGEVEFLIAVNFYQGKYLSNWIPYHPPLKLALTYLLFHSFGYSSYSFLGVIFGIVGIIALYRIAERLFDQTTAVTASIILSLSGIYISSAIFSVNDFLVTVFILCSFSFYLDKKFIVSALFSCCAVLSKESAIMFPLSIILIEGYTRKIRWEYILPFCTLVGWILFLHVTGHTLWNSWNFSPSPKNGSVFTIIDNVLGVKIFNAYAYENWLHLFVFNYNWVIWLAALGSLRYIKWNKYISVIVLFSFLYILLILSFQTFSIPRYVLPILTFVYIFTAVFITKIKYNFITIPLIFIVIVLSLFTSNDPVSNIIWHKQQILNQGFYINQSLDGNDGITYNMQYLYLTMKRNYIIKNRNCVPYIQNIQTISIYPQTLKILNIPSCQ